MSSLPDIACHSCGHVNEGQRIFCHECGAKLDRSGVIAKEREAEESREKKRRKVKKLMNPGRGSALDTFKSALRALLWAAVAAAVISIVRPPEKVPPMPEGLVEAPPLGIFVEELTMASPGRQIAFTEADINNYLQNTVRPGKEPRVAVFQRAYVQLEEGLLRITSQIAVGNHPLYAGATYRLKIENGALSALPAGIHLGKLEIPEPVAKHAGPALELMLKPLWNSLRRERTSVGKVGSIEVHKGQIVMRSKGQAQAPFAAAPAPAP